MYRHGSYISELSTNPINTLVDCDLSEPAIGYAWVLKHHATYLWRLAATYPGCTIDSYNNNVGGVFPQITHPSDITRGNVSLHDKKMIVSVPLHFGGSYGLASWEPIARALCFLAQWMFQHTSYQEQMNNEANDLMTLPDDNDTGDACTIRPQFDKINGTVQDSAGAFVPEYRISVNNLLSAIPWHLMQTCHFIVSSNKFVYTLLGYPGLRTAPDLPPTMSWDKIVDRAVGPDRLSLGVEFLNRNLEMTVNNYKVECLLELLNIEWSSGRKSFTVLAAAVLIGNVYTATLTCTWLRWTLHQLIAAMKVLI